MTIQENPGTVLWMAKRTGTPIPREGTTPTEYKLALAKRIRERREFLDLSHVEVAEQLSQMIGREIRPDSYRQWETIKSIVQVDAILPLCDILQIHVYDLLGKPAVRPRQQIKSPLRGKAVA